MIILVFEPEIIFDCPELGISSGCLAEAMEWKLRGHCVTIERDGEDIGFLTFGGKCKTADSLPTGADCGLVFYCEETNAYHISMPA